MVALSELLKNPDWHVALAATTGILLLIQRFECFDVPTWVVPALVASCVLFSVLSAIAFVSSWLAARD